MATNKITLNELRSIVRQVINEEIKVNYMDGKKFIIENQVSNNPTVQNLEKKAWLHKLNVLGTILVIPYMT
jgi:hypothetical protein